MRQMYELLDDSFMCWSWKRGVSEPGGAASDPDCRVPGQHNEIIQ